MARQIRTETGNQSEKGITMNTMIKNGSAPANECFRRIPIALLKGTELKQTERAAYKLMITLEKLRKRIPEVIPECDRASKLWLLLWTAIKERDAATAAREEELWTVFVPEKYGLKEVRRTKHWRITKFWNTKHPMFGEPYKVPGKPDASKVLLIDDPWRDFAHEQKRQVAA